MPPQKYIRQTFILNVSGNTFKITGRKIVAQGWKAFTTIFPDRHVSVQSEKTEDDSQILDSVNWNEVYLADIETAEKWTKPPKHFNEASILSFMENPKFDRHVSLETETHKKLVGIGTAATRHTFIPKLMKSGYIELQKKNFICTPLGSFLLDTIRNSSIQALADITATTQWEEDLAADPIAFGKSIKEYVRTAVTQTIKVSTFNITSLDDILCPLCKRPIRESQKSWFCTGYKDGCTFKSLWKETRGTTFSKTDIKNLCSGKKSAVKKCTKKDGGSYECAFILNPKKNYELEPVFLKRK